MSLILTTERLQLRPLAATDTEAFYQLCVEPGVRRYLFDDKVISRETADEIVQKSAAYFADKGYGLWAIRPRDEESILGVCGYWFFREPPELELLYLLSQAHWGRGIAVEAARAVLRYGFEQMGFARIQACTDAPNVASIRVMEKLGMSFLDRRVVDGLDTVFYDIPRQAFEHSAAQGMY